MLISINKKSLRKHEITWEQVQETMTDPMRAVFDVYKDEMYKFDDASILRQMIVGSTYADVLLEVGVEMIGNEALHIFHAQKVSPGYRKKYKEWLKNAQA